MRKRYTVQALVLSRKSVGEADRLVVLFDREQGIVRAYAKGVRKIPSHRGGHLEVCTRVAADISESKAGAYIGNVHTLEYFHGLQSSESCVDSSVYMSRIVLSLLDEHDPAPELHDALLWCWHALQDASDSKRLVYESMFSMIALRQAGLAPNVDVCVQCKERAKRDVVLDVSSGGFFCVSCKAGDASLRMPFRIFRAFRFLLQRPYDGIKLALDEGDARALQRCSRAYMARALHVET